MNPPQRRSAANKFPEPPDECANCGTPLRRDAKACPECGADERSGWRAESIYDGLDLPEDAFEDDKSRPRATKPVRRINGLAWYWWGVGLVVAVLFVRGVWGRF